MLWRPGVAMQLLQRRFRVDCSLLQSLAISSPQADAWFTLVELPEYRNRVSQGRSRVGIQAAAAGSAQIAAHRKACAITPVMGRCQDSWHELQCYTVSRCAIHGHALDSVPEHSCVSSNKASDSINPAHPSHDEHPSGYMYQITLTCIHVRRGKSTVKHT